MPEGTTREFAKTLDNVLAANTALREREHHANEAPDEEMPSPNALDPTVARLEEAVRQVGEWHAAHDAQPEPSAFPDAVTLRRALTKR